MIIAISIIVADVLLIILYIYYKKRFLILSMPFDYGYRVFKRAYRAYTPVREGKKSYDMFAMEYKDKLHNFIKDKKVDSEQYATNNRMIFLIDNHREFLETTLSTSFGYMEYLEISAECDMMGLAKKEETKTTNKYKTSLLRKIILTRSIFRAAEIDVSDAEMGRYIQKFLEVETENPTITNTNIYKQIKKSKKAPDTDKEIKSRAEDLTYVINELKSIGLVKESRKSENELEEYKELIID